ncbi:MAG: type I-C CRISPR-associated protein Cas8c/Csd1 [Proteobacteria bacterium]|nr:type I-C CRISPR-associated protein Cas8c/Csd1 [Pseudomonadota bacterium]
MILQSLNQFAKDKNLLSVEKQAFKQRKIDFLIDLDDKGKLLGVMDFNKETLSCPVSLREKSMGGVADFLVARPLALFGKDLSGKKISEKQAQRRNANNLEKFNDFWKQIKDAYATTQFSPLYSALQFQPVFNTLPDSMLYTEEDLNADTNQNSPMHYWIVLSDGTKKQLKETHTFTFSILQQPLVNNPEIHTYWSEEFQKEALQGIGNAPKGLCSITGEHQKPLAKTHNPKIKGVPNSQATGSKISSFDKASFTSFGFEQSLNAAASIEASTGYCKALNFMLNRDSRHSISLANSICCYWSKDPKNPVVFTLNDLFESANPDLVKDFLNQPYSGKSSSHQEQDRFYALILSGNGGRIMVRHWIDIPFKEAQDNFRSWFEDLELLEAKTSKNHKASPLGIFQLAKSTVRDAKELRTETITQLFLAAFNGTPPALSLLLALQRRLKVAMAQQGNKALWNHSMFALMKLILNRHQRIYNKENSMEVSQELDEHASHPGYLCGRLLSVLSRCQEKAHNYSLSGAGVAERYFATAMSSPQSVFPLLMKLNRHHLNKIQKTDSSSDHFYERDIAFIMQHLKAFPRTLDLKGQSYFALGYYHEQAATLKKIEEWREQNHKKTA